MSFVVSRNTGGQVKPLWLATHHLPGALHAHIDDMSEKAQQLPLVDHDSVAYCQGWSDGSAQAALVLV
jgi:hypothetical protein